MPGEGSRTPNITIVGGRPPGERGPHGGREGIDTVLLRAALDKRFGARFVSQPEVALARCGIELSEVEREVLLSSTPEQREAMVEGVARNLVDRRGWFARLAGALGLFVAGTALMVTDTGCYVPSGSKGHDVSLPPRTAGQSQPAHTETVIVESDESEPEPEFAEFLFEVRERRPERARRQGERER